MIKRLHIIFAALTLPALTLPALPLGAAAKPALGQRAPEFALPNQHNKTVTLADFRGR